MEGRKKGRGGHDALMPKRVWQRHQAGSLDEPSSPPASKNHITYEICLVLDKKNRNLTLRNFSK